MRSGQNLKLGRVQLIEVVAPRPRLCEQIVVDVLRHLRQARGVIVRCRGHWVMFLSFFSRSVGLRF